MKKTILLFILLLAFGINAKTQTGENLNHESNYVRLDTLVLSEDSVVVITTACAPLCHSIVKVYDRHSREIGQIQCPDKKALFTEAYIEDRKILWQNNTPANWDKTY